MWKGVREISRIIKGVLGFTEPKLPVNKGKIRTLGVGERIHFYLKERRMSENMYRKLKCESTFLNVNNVLKEKSPVTI